MGTPEGGCEEKGGRWMRRESVVGCEAVEGRRQCSRSVQALDVEEETELFGVREEVLYTARACKFMSCWASITCAYNVWIVCAESSSQSKSLEDASERVSRVEFQ